ncbi:M23 family metallopeptidase [Cohnella endophytica]|uniref:M23 family metallopeptidase n=1 Tax=Cohnella endophytica TaxID=2419778 RepID=A0A494Y7L7_9BACL|nr:M23 family metallopeptidase [Cohnella endophytica]
MACVSSAFVLFLLPFDDLGAMAATSADKSVDTGMYEKRRLLYESIALKSGLDWHFVAAIDQYERTMSRAHPKTRPISENAVSGVYVTESDWSGDLNPETNDSNPSSIRFFRGIGRDGSGDGVADRRKDEDALFSVAAQVAKQGSAEDDLAIGLWEYYHNTRAVQRVMQFVMLYRHFDRLDLSGNAFPLPLESTYSFRSTWGNSRGWGGKRIHEGTDIFANYGVPVKSTCYGVVEMKGWNAFGGWRIGIRDLNNLYHYYAHLSGFDKKIKMGDIVRPGQVIGYVGSSGYGRPGTQGKFPPHLHYGVYRDRGLVEWAFDPYPLLRRWEREELKSLKASKH